MTIRGSHPVEIPVAWRLDGAATAPDAPLVVALHGMGMDEDVFALLLQRLFDLPFRFLIPRGPYPVEVRREGRIGASWYAYDGDQERFRAELLRTEALLLALISDVERAHDLRPRTRVLLGFSQGGYCGSYVALRNPATFGALVLSGARVKHEILDDEIRAAGEAGFRALLCHGERDASVAPDASERSRDALRDGGVATEHLTFDTGHSLGRAQISAIAEWLRVNFG